VSLRAAGSNPVIRLFLLDIMLFFLIVLFTISSLFFFSFSNILLYILVFPFLGAVHLIIMPTSTKEIIKKIAFGYSALTFLLSLFLWLLFDNATADFQFVKEFLWIPATNLNFYIGVDGISLFFLILTTFLIPLCILASWDSIKHHLKEYLIILLVLESLLIAVFCVLDLFLFYIFFESVLIPMFAIILLWGSRERKIRASYMFFLYTFIGSLIMLFTIFFIFSKTGTLNYQILLTLKFDNLLQKIFFLSFFISFATKIPVIPVHVWLPEAHVEAPTAGSVILAGILLKLGTYGLLRFAMPLFPYATVYFTPFVYTIAAISVVYTSLTAIRQTDLKRVIAYSSVAHMNLILIGMFALNIQGLEGGILQMLSHGFVSSALFLCIGVLYDRYHSRLIKYYSGLAHLMPIFTFFFLFFTMANIALPGTSSFVGELLILAGSFQSNTVITFFGATGMILGGAYSLWLFNRIVYGNLKIQYVQYFSDINRREFFVFLPLFLGTLLMGVYPDIFLNPIHISVQNLVDHIIIQNN
jgi:proton-translocating NADH-quinone oxidoreductase chain M